MRAFLTSLSALLLLGLLTVTSPQAARADEEPKDESAASKACRDAWWAETGGGNLNQALELYAKAIDAEGPASVKARALYRRAVVLQRIGKTEEALRALERLSKDFPGEAQMNADARARLAEWTAVDLRSSFADWFKRYQYSPEFQAKVIDLVLRLGSSVGNEAQNAEQELLTIGEASIPALKEHVRSKNVGLQQRAMKVLVLLGIVPEEILEVGGPWVNQSEAWTQILGLPAERKAALRARITEKTPVREALTAALTGPEAVVAYLQTAGQGEGVRHVLFNVLVMTLPRESPLTAVLADLALAPGQDPNFRGTVAWWAREKGLVTAALVRAWATHDAKQLRDAAWWLVAQGKLLPPAEGWPLVLERLERALPLNEEGSFPGALFVTLEAAPWPQDRERTAKALLAQLHTGHSLSGMPTAPQTLARERYLEVLSRVFELTTDENVGGRVLSAMQQLLPKDVRGLRTVATWARTAPTRQRRDIAVMELANHAERQEGGLSAEDIEVFDDLLTDPSIPVEESGQAWQRTFQGRLGADLIRSPKALRRLLDRMRGVADGHMGSRLANALLQPVRSNLVGPEPIVEALLAAPDQAPSHLLGSGSLQKALVDRRQLPRWRQAWREAWPRWNDEQRRSGIFLLSQLLAPGDEPEMVAFLRERLRSRPSEIPVGVREVAMRTFGELTWDDLKAAYDLSKVEEVDAAAGWFVSPGGNQPSLVGEQPKVKPTAEIFAALRPALRPDSPTAFLGAAPRVFRDVPEVHRELAAVLLASDGVYHASAVELLASRAAPEDEDLWLKALRDARVDVRVAAARGMERVPTDGLKRALVGALDDPHPDVRAAALASLDNLQKMEDLKARWRERVK